MTPRGRGLLAVALAMLGACGPASSPPPPAQLADPLRVSGPSPYPPGCNPIPAGNPGVGDAVAFVGAEAEPHLAIDPGDPRHLVGAWQQDRWRGGGANGVGSAVSFDGGRSWTRSDARFTICSGGTLAGGAYPRASDPWVSIGLDGTVHLLALAFDNHWAGTRSAILASRSTDGGLTWSPPARLALETTRDVSLDKCSLTADWTRAGHAYAVWDRLSGLDGPGDSTVSGPAEMARTVDGGLTWEGPWTLYDPGVNAQTISSQIVVLPDQTLVNMLVVITGLSAMVPTVEVALLRSIDAGLTWSATPYTVSAWQSVGIVDPRGGTRVRGGDVVPTVAVDRRRGALYVAWQQAFGGVDGIAFSRSLDGGVTWSTPTQANGDASVPAFTPSLAVAGNGHVGLGYYDWREQPTGSGPGLWTTRWLATSTDGGLTWSDAPDGGPFDLRRAPDVPGYFLGDYMGLVGGAGGFTSLFTMSLPGDGDERTDVYAGPPQP